jgi:predicted glycosyltransferase
LSLVPRSAGQSGEVERPLLEEAAMKPTLLFYCQPSPDPDRLIRSWVLAHNLSAMFYVVLVTGGELPAGMTPPPAVEVIRLPDGAPSARARLVLDTFFLKEPTVVLTELFPFGHQAFTAEIQPMLEYAAAARRRPLVICSIPDPPQRTGRKGKDDGSAARVADALYDAILLHTDPRLATVEEAFGSRVAVRVPVMHTGLVTAPPFISRTAPDRRGIVVSAGSGRTGAPLFRAALEAHALSPAATRPPMRIVTGPHLPADQHVALQLLAAPFPDLTIEDSAPARRALLASAALSISQCGYHTALDVLQARVPALVVPVVSARDYAQRSRADRLGALGALRVLVPGELTGSRLAIEIAATPAVPRTAVDLNTDGAIETMRVITHLWQLLESRRHFMASAC